MVALSNSRAAIFARVFQADRAEFDPKVAEMVLSWDFTEADHARMDELAEKAQLGSLTEHERHEAENFNDVLLALGTLHSKARRCLREQTRQTV